MTNEQINIAIAEECGWKIDQERKTHGFKPLTDGCRTYAELPDYCTDLNAMHEAEMTLTANQFEQYRWILWDICKQFRVKGWYRCYLSSTARQRAETFLQTLGKWEE